MSPEERKMRARMAINSRWARPLARQEQAEAARAAFDRRMRKLVDPEGVLPEAEVQLLMASARRAHSAALHLAKARKSRKDDAA